MSRKHAYPHGENGIVRLLESRYPAGAGVERGIGDDAAVLGPEPEGEYRLVTTDMLVEQIDFRREWAPARKLGRKAVSVNLSDIAAMGARPRFFTVALGLPADVPRSWIAQLYRGLTEQGNAFGASLVGGDLSASPSGIVISITLLGESVGRTVLYRSGGRAGDALYVTGILGRSAAGLRLLQGGRPLPNRRAEREAVRAHLEPEPRCEAGMWLCQCGMVRCMMDLSDGLSADFQWV